MTATAAVRERPIIFSSESVRAILSGSKTQTRRVMKVQPPAECGIHYMLGNESWLSPDERTPLRHTWEAWHGPLFDARPEGALCGSFDINCPYGAPGDRLWIKERWFPAFARTATNSGVMFPSFANPHGAPLGHPQEANPGWSPNGKGGGWKSPIHMPRWASRITLEITDVRVQRLQEISEDDAIAEGVDGDDGSGVGDMPDGPIIRFAALWDSLNAARGYSWDSNPWVWVLSFTRAGRIG